MKNHLFPIFVINLFFSCTQPEKPVVFNLKELEPIVLKSEPPELHQYWEIQDHPAVWSLELPRLPALQAYRDALGMLLGKSVLDSLVGQQKTVLPGHDFGSEKDSLPNWEFIHAGNAGTIRPINSLEAQLLDYQLGRYQMIGHPTEFVSYVLKNDSLNLLRIYFTASDTPWPPKWHPVSAHYEPAVESGNWKMLQAIHNHYSDPPPKGNYLGVLAPSLADAHLFKNYLKAFDLKEAPITNGFHTVVLSGDDFEKMDSH